jgi:hypothetical protein
VSLGCRYWQLDTYFLPVAEWDDADEEEGGEEEDEKDVVAGGLIFL